MANTSFILGAFYYLDKIFIIILFNEEYSHFCHFIILIFFKYLIVLFYFNLKLRMGHLKKNKEWLNNTLIFWFKK